MAVNHDQAPVTDTGTGAYPNPPSEVTYEANVGTEPTGAVEGPPAEVTYTSEDYGDPTGAHPNPPAEVSYSQWPAEAPAGNAAPEPEPAEEKAVADVPDEAVEESAEDKTVKPAARKRSSTKRGS